MSNWRDITTYSQKGPREISSVEISVGDLRLVVTRKIYCEGWWMRILPLGKEQLLKSKDLDEAKAEAIRILRVWISNLSKALEKLES